MNRIKTLFAALCLAAIVAVVPAASAQTVHFIGAGSSAQWQEAALGAYSKVQALAVGSKCSYHFTAKGNNADLNPAAQLVDPRNVNIPNEPGNVWIIWIGDCGSPSTGITDVWLDITVDSTVGVRAFFASYKVGTVSHQGVQVQLDSSNRTSSDAIKAALYSDSSADTGTAVPSAILTAVNGSNINVGLTDIRPEDALYATTRALAVYNGTIAAVPGGESGVHAGLGYNHGPVSGVGNTIASAVTATALATPVKFYLAGTDPLGHGVIAPYATLPVGAAPIVYIMNNGGTSPIALDLEDGYPGDTSNPLANLLDGTTACTPANPAFNGTGVGTTPLVVFLREPLSGTMNTNEFNVIRTSYSLTDSQEKGILSTTTTPYNPLNLTCGTVAHPLAGFRRRGVGTGDIVTGVSGTSNSIGYIFFSFGNVSSLNTTKYNYLTLDGVDPFYTTTPSNQPIPQCSVGPPNTCDKTHFNSGNDYPSIRNGSYRDWSLYRWVGQPGSAHFCSDNSLSNPITACQPVVGTPTKATYAPTTGLVTLTFASTISASVGESVVVTGFTDGTAVQMWSQLNCASGCAVTKVTNAGTNHSIVYSGLAAHLLHLPPDTTHLGSATLNPATDAYGIQALAQAAQDAVDTGVADFVPFNPTSGVDGMNVYRSHASYDYSATQNFVANNGALVNSGGNLTRGGGPEAGSDVGGCIELHDVDVISGLTNDTECKQ